MGQVDVPIPALGGCCCSPRGRGAEQSLLPVLLRRQGASPELGWSPGGIPAGLRGFGWMDRWTGVPFVQDPASSGVLEVQIPPCPTTVIHHACPSTSYTASSTASQHTAPSMSMSQLPPCPTTYLPPGPPDAPTVVCAFPLLSLLPSGCFFYSLPAARTPGLCNLRLKDSISNAVSGFCLQKTTPLTFLPFFYSPPTFKYVTHCLLFY